MKDFITHNLKNQDALKKITDPLSRHFGIDIFWYGTLHENGYTSGLSNHFEQWLHCYTNGLYKNVPFLIAPSGLKAGNYLLEFDDEYAKVQEHLEDKYPLHHPLVIIRKEGNKMAHIYGFGSSCPCPSLPSFYSNNFPLLNKYIDYFIDSTLPKKSLNPEFMIDLGTLIGHSTYYKARYGAKEHIDPYRHSQFFKNVGIDIPPQLFAHAKLLSPREKEVLIGLREGLHSPQIGQKLGLTFRTVQFYTENIKNKLGLFTREELIECAKVLTMLEVLE